MDLLLVVFLDLQLNAFFLLPCDSKEKNDMKSLMFTLGALAMTFTLTAQDARLSSEQDARGGVYRTNIRAGEF